MPRRLEKVQGKSTRKPSVKITGEEGHAYGFSGAGNRRVCAFEPAALEGLNETNPKRPNFVVFWGVQKLTVPYTWVYIDSPVKGCGRRMGSGVMVAGFWCIYYEKPLSL